MKLAPTCLLGIKKILFRIWLRKGGGVCGGTVGSYRTSRERSERITCPQAAPIKITSHKTGYFYCLPGTKKMPSIFSSVDLN